MKQPVQDSETGETENVSVGVETIVYNEETGEPESETTTKMHFQKTKFNVPKKYLQGDVSINHKKCILQDCKETYTLTDKEKVIHLKEEIILGYNKTSHRLFLIPSLFLFTKLTALIFSISEILLHIWAHRKNSANTNPNIYYRSPLHVLTSEFCAICRSQAERDHIYKLQDRSRRLHASLKEMTRTLS